MSLLLLIELHGSRHNHNNIQLLSELQVYKSNQGLIEESDNNF